MERMYDKEYWNVIVPAHPKEDVNASRTDKEKKVMKQEKNCNKGEERARRHEGILWGKVG